MWIHIVGDNFSDSTFGTCHVYGVYADIFEIISQAVIFSVGKKRAANVLNFSNKSYGNFDDKQSKKMIFSIVSFIMIIFDEFVATG